MTFNMHHTVTLLVVSVSVTLWSSMAWTVCGAAEAARRCAGAGNAGER